MVDRTLTVYKEGLLYKRQRGLHKSNTKALKFQERFCRLTSTSLDYYDPNPRKRDDGPKGQFAVDRVKIVELLQPHILGKEYPHVFQIGDNTEVMYLAAKSQRERDYWIEAFRKAAKDAGNRLLSHYHHGVFGVVNKGRWSCCGIPQRTSPGCTSAPGYLEGGVAFIRSYPPSHSNPKDRTSTMPLEAIPPPATPKEDQPSTSTASNKTLTEASTSVTPNPVPVIKPGVPLIRSFTLADPLMQRPNMRRIKELRASKASTRDFEDLLERGGGSLPEESFLSSGGSCKDNDITDFVSKLGLQDVTPKKKGQDLGELGKIAQELQGNFSQNGSSRSGASSPAPSTDSGKGASAGSSRPGSQVLSVLEGDERRMHSESIGKRSDLSVQSDQGVVPDGETLRAGSIVRQRAVEEPDGPQIQTKLDKRESELSVFTDEGGGPQTPKESPSAGHGRQSHPPAPLPVVMEQSDSVTPNNEKKRGRVPSSISLENIVDSSKRMSFLSDSISSTPLRRSARMRNSSINFLDEQGRPMSVLMPQNLPPLLSRLHVACKDGNLGVLEEELGMEYLNLEETSLGPLPYTPLFHAFLSDHYQTMVRLLEHGANPNGVESVGGASVLHLACQRGCLDVVELLLQYSVEVNQEDASGNTPLMEACKSGHMDIVELLLKNGADVDHEGGNGRTPLHEASEAGYNGITELLVREGRADPIPRDNDDATPYDLAFNNGYEEVMQVLQSVIPESVRPYSLLRSHAIPSGQMVTSLSFRGSDVLISGSRDCYVSFWNTLDLSPVHHVQMLDTVLSVHMWNNTLVIGSTSTQLVNMDNYDRRRTIVDTSMEEEDEDLENPPLHLVTFGSQGRLATAAVEGNTVKLWPPVSSKSNIVSIPDTSIAVGQELPGCIYCLAMSCTSTCPWLAVGTQPGKLFEPSGNKLVYLLNWQTKKVQHIFDGGDGGPEVSLHMMFSPNGECLAIGCAGNLCVWEANSATLLHKFSTTEGTQVTSLSYSPDGAHLAAGLSNGEVQVFEISSSGPIFTLQKPQRTSPATAMAYSEDGGLLAVGHHNGLLQQWEAYIGQRQPSND